ncbi:glycoside hydrolase family 36 protein [Rathayibacter sp. CAU 1779]
MIRDAAALSNRPRLLVWGGSAVALTFLLDPDAPVSLVGMERRDAGAVELRDAERRRDPHRDRPLVELSAHGHGRFPGGYRHVDTVIGARLRYSGFDADPALASAPSPPGGVRTLRLRQRDPETGLEVVSVFEERDGIAAFRTWTEVSRGAGDDANDDLVVTFVSTFVSAAPYAVTGRDVDRLALMTASSDWVAESRWRTVPLREAGLAEIDRELQHHPPRSRCVVTGRGSWSTGEALPTGMLVAQDPDDTSTPVAWQLEHNGPWLYELGETRATAYLLLSGPSDEEHQWSALLRNGESVRSVPASVALGTPGGAFDTAIAALTDQRRALRLLRDADAALPLVFNDYMNTLMGDPTTQKLLPLIDAAAAAGADCFCIDAGWYADGHWWDNVGEWMPSAERFPGGIGEVIGRIREHGMTAGLWIEPEVIGLRSPLAATLPDAAFFSRGGVRVAEHGRYLLDFRHPATRAHLDAVVDRIVGEYGVAFLKMDYNTMPGPGTDRDAQSPGDGLRRHADALLEWIDGVQARHPQLLIESCASGAMRADYAMLSRLHLQSTSDQQDPVRYATIAAAASASILPEQAGHWAYPNPDMDDELFALSLVNGVIGRMYLSGYLNRMSPGQLALVHDAIAAHREVLSVTLDAHPRWPLGLPGWTDAWVCAGLATSDGGLYLSVWRRTAHSSRSLEVPLPELRGRRIHVKTTFPQSLAAWEHEWDEAAGVLRVTTPPDAPAARVLRIDV